MKKMLFSAIAMIAFSVSGVASDFKKDKVSEVEKEIILNEVNELYEDEFGCVYCTYTINTYDEEGNVISSKTETYRVCNMNCEQGAKKVNDFFQNKKGLTPGR